MKITKDERSMLLYLIEAELYALYSFLDCGEGELAQKISILEDLKEKVYKE